MRASVADRSPRRVESAVTAAMDRLAGGGPAQEIRRPVSYLNPLDQAAPYVVSLATGARTPGVVFQATGALEALIPAPGSPEPGDTGLWLPDSVASRLDLGVGDQVGLQLALPGTEPAPAPATVTGVYVTAADGSPEDRTGRWTRLTDELPSWPGHVVPTTAQLPLLVADTRTYRSLVAGIGELSLVTWDVAPDANPLRVADLARLYESAAVLREELKSPASDVRQEVQHRGSNPVTLSTGLSRMVSETRSGLRATEQGVAAVRILAAGLSWLVVALAAVALLVRRRGERQVLVEQGRSTLELTALSVVEAVLPIGLGLLVGWWAAPPFVSAIVGTDGVGPRPLDAGLVGGVVLATVAVACAVDAVARHRRASGRAVVTASRVPWRSAVLALAGAGAISAYRGDGDFDAVTAAFPLAAVGAAAIVFSAAATTVLGRLVRRWLPARLGPRLTLSRLARDPSSATAFLAATVAFGAAGYGLLFHASASDAITDKVATGVGANSVFAVSDPVATAALAADVGESTVVLRTVPRINGFTGDRLFAVDSGTFGSAALWSPRFAGHELSELTRELGAGPDVDAVPVVLAGNGEHVPASGTLARGDDFQVRYRVVDRIAGFAGSGPWQTVLVVDQETLLALAPPGAHRHARGRAVECAGRRHGRSRRAHRRSQRQAPDHGRHLPRRPRFAGGPRVGDPLPPGVHRAGPAARAARPRRTASQGPRAAAAAGPDARRPRSSAPAGLAGVWHRAVDRGRAGRGRGRSRGVRRHHLTRVPARPGADPRAAPRGDRDRAAPGRRGRVRGRRARPHRGRGGRGAVAGPIPVRQRAAAR